MARTHTRKRHAVRDFAARAKAIGDEGAGGKVEGATPKKPKLSKLQTLLHKFQKRGDYIDELEAKLQKFRERHEKDTAKISKLEDEVKALKIAHSNLEIVCNLEIEKQVNLRQQEEMDDFDPDEYNDEMTGYSDAPDDVADYPGSYYYN